MMRKIPKVTFKCLSSDINSIHGKIASALNSFDLLFDQLKCSFTEMKKQFNTLNANLDENKLSPCFQPTIRLLRNITESIPNSLFFVQYQSARANFDKTKNEYEDNYKRIKKDANTAKENLTKIIVDLQKRVDQLKSQQNINSHLIEFYPQLKLHSTNATNILLDYQNVSLGTINRINSNVQEILTPIMKISGLHFPNELDQVFPMLQTLIQNMKEELNVSYIIQSLMIPILSPVLKSQNDPQTTHCVINYFELEHKLADGGRAKLIEDYEYEGIHVKAGETIKLFTPGYSRYWKAKTTSEAVIYVPSEILRII